MKKQMDYIPRGMARAKTSILRSGWEMNFRDSLDHEGMNLVDITNKIPKDQGKGHATFIGPTKVDLLAAGVEKIKKKWWGEAKTEWRAVKPWLSQASGSSCTDGLPTYRQYPGAYSEYQMTLPLGISQ